MKIEEKTEKPNTSREKKNAEDEEKKKETVTQLIHSILLYIFFSCIGSEEERVIQTFRFRCERM